MIHAIGVWQVVIIAFVILLLFGGSRLPKLMKGLVLVSKNLKTPLRKMTKTMSWIRIILLI